MSSQAPRTLLELAGRSLLMDSQRATLALQDLPIELFPPLFMEAFSGRHREVLKEMVRAWPFTCLPLGALMKKPDLEMLQVTLQGLNMLLAQRDRPRRWRLQVLDLRQVHHNFWRMWTGEVADACSPEAMPRKQTVAAPPGTGPLLPLKVLADLCLPHKLPYPPVAFVLQWMDGKPGVVQLCCKKLQVSTLSLQSMERILEKLDLDYIQQVEMHCPWSLSILASFATYLGQMRNLRKLLFSHVQVSVDVSQEEKDWLMDHVTSQFAKMDSLRRLYLDDAFSLDGRLCQVLRHLKNPLETLSITNCQPSDSDWNHLSGSPNLAQLLHLNLCGIKQTNLSPEPLRILLENAAATLRTLNLQDCEITDSQLQVLLPALSGCSQLRTFSFQGNNISLPVMRDLLRHTARLRQLSLEMYPAPLESYNAQGAIHRERFFQHYAELTDILRAVREPKRVLFHTKPCHICGHRFVYNLPSSLCRCLMPA
ncbi:PRAME family member 12 [Sciurus carolinensis]|uniref:PRAME family member 12 n=1 Tax=Sciurus carolinensis TaxID=30640 RepID=A0AA41MC37_SCICA|nr:PRAME family member 12 [Sciurus carolinensis]